MWGATSKGISIAFDFNRFQSTRPVWGATYLAIKFLEWVAEFQSTRPVWGATDGLSPSESVE